MSDSRRTRTCPTLTVGIARRALAGHHGGVTHSAALTDGYSLAFSIAAGLLVATAAVAMATLPSRREVRALASVASEDPALRLELDEA